ncbi:phenylalanine--tRNA ligase subunit beta [Candidatus Fermentibacteria bacterium]|nr:MAG: phenylalanine--tRNA ligase subunit beta [Candidatus Fermentibacteria bacterium]
MPKIEVPLKDLLSLSGLKGTEGLEEMLEPLKAELDGVSEDVVKIELNDTNRPDLWTAEGVARALRCYRSFRSEKHLDDLGTSDKTITVSSELKEIRPFIAAFTATGWTVDRDGLDSLIAAQEKLASSFGKERRTAAIGFYSLDRITFPVSYETASPNTVFQPLGEETEMTFAGVLEETETGMKYAGLLKDFKAYPVLRDSAGEILSFPPVLNSNFTGRVEPGHSRLFCEVTGTDWHTVNLTLTILACCLEDRGARIEPVAINYHTGKVVTPVIYSDTLTVDLNEISSVIGVDAQKLDIEKLLSRMDYSEVRVEGNSVTAVMPPYRRDGIHPADLIEDVAIACGLNNLEPLLPSEYTVGASAPSELLASAVKTLLVGLGCEEIIRPVLTSCEKICDLTATPEPPVAIKNPMTLEYGVVTNTLLPALLEVESVSGYAAFPHDLFTVGEVLLRKDDGTVHTEMNLAVTSGDSDFGRVHSILGALCHYRDMELVLEDADDSRFIPGRSARVLINGNKAGILGEIRPEVIESWGIAVPVAGFEISLKSLS